MSRLLITYPTIAEGDFRWIQQIRVRHDGLHYEVVAPHFTAIAFS